MMDQEQVIQKIAQKSGKTKEQLQGELKKYYEELAKTDATEDYRKEFAFRKLIATYRKVLASRAETFEGVFVGVTGRMNMVAKKRADADKYFRENPEEAIKKGITDREGNPLFYATPEQIAKMPDWMQKRVGQPLPKEDWQRTVFGVIKSKNGYKNCQLRLRGDNTKVKVPLFAQLTFNALPLQSSTPELERLNDSGAINFNITKELSDNEAKSLIESKFKDRIITINGIDKFCEEHDEWGRYVIMKVIVTEIVPQVTTMGSQMIRIEDNTIDFLDDKGEVIPPVVCFIDEEMITFPERSEIYLIGQPNVTDRGKNIGVFGVYVPKIFRNLVPSPRAIPKEEETSW